jgi:hypothetical protein
MLLASRGLGTRQWKNGFSASRCDLCFELFYFNIKYKLLVVDRFHPIILLLGLATIAVPFIDTLKKTGTFMHPGQSPVNKKISTLSKDIGRHIHLLAAKAATTYKLAYPSGPGILWLVSRDRGMPFLRTAWSPLSRRFNLAQ